MRTIISEIVLTIHAAERRADIEILWEGGAKTELAVRLGTNVFERRRTSEDTIELIRRLAAHHPDRQIAQILSRQGRLTASGLPFTQARVQSVRTRAGIPAAPPPDPDPASYEQSKSPKDAKGPKNRDPRRPIRPNDQPVNKEVQCETRPRGETTTTLIPARRRLRRAASSASRPAKCSPSAGVP